MKRVLYSSLGAVLLAAALGMPAQAQQRPQIETKKVDGTENVYIFRNGNHQSMFIVTKDGVIATDPVAYGRPTGGQQYVDEIKKVTDKPIKFLIYSHHHFDHIAGGKAFKDAGARVIAHKNATARLKVLQDPHTPLPDESVGNKKVIKLGGTTLELHYLGLNHSDSTLVMRLPKEKIVFIVDTIPVGAFPGRGFIDIYPLETEEFLKKVMAMDWERMIPGHPGQPNGRLGNKDDVKAVAHADAGGFRRDEEDGPGGQVLGRGREGVQAGEVRNSAGLRERTAVRRAALLRTVGPRDLTRCTSAQTPRAALASGPFVFMADDIGGELPLPASAGRGSGRGALLRSRTRKSPHPPRHSASKTRVTRWWRVDLSPQAGRGKRNKRDGERSKRRERMTIGGRYRALAAALSIEAAVWPNRIARSSAVRMPPWPGLTVATCS